MTIKQAVIDLDEQGYRYSDIAKKVGISEREVQEILGKPELVIGGSNAES